MLPFSPWTGLLYSMLSANNFVAKTLVYSPWCSIYLLSSSQKFWIFLFGSERVKNFKNS